MLTEKEQASAKVLKQYIDKCELVWSRYAKGVITIQEKEDKIMEIVNHVVQVISPQ